MTDQSDQPAAPKLSGRAKRIAKQRAAQERAMRGPAITVTPKLGGPSGRARSLDPDQNTFNNNVALLMGLGTIQAEIAEVASTLNVSPGTLYEFFARYPEVKARFEDAKKTGHASVRRHQYDLSKTSPQMAIKLGELWLGQRDPYRVAEIEQRERALAQAAEALALRERDVAAREAVLALKQPADLGSGLPIDIGSLSLQQLIQLAGRIRQAMQLAGGLTGSQIAAPAPPGQKTGTSG